MQRAHPGATASDLPPVCILAGGRGARLGDLTAAAPKPLLMVAGRPFIEHQLELLRHSGARRIVVCTGYLGDQFQVALGDGSRFGLELSYSRDEDELAGTAEAIRLALDILGPEFLVLYGDTYLRIDYCDVARRFRESGRPGLMAVLRNRGRWGPSNAVLAGGLVVAYDKKAPPAGAEWIDYGLLAFRREVFLELAERDLSDVTGELARRAALAGYVASKRFYEIGTPESLAETERFLTRATEPSGGARAWGRS